MEEGEREVGETDEQFEERVLNRRAAQLFAVMKPKLADGMHLPFDDLAPRHNNRKQVNNSSFNHYTNWQRRLCKFKWLPRAVALLSGDIRIPCYLGYQWLSYLP